MPYNYLSPSTQPYNVYATGGNEQASMNLLADHMEPYLTASGIQYLRKDLSMSAADAIRQSNEGVFDLHLGLHSNAAPDSLSGQLRGIIVFFQPGNQESIRISNQIAEGLKTIYPHPNSVRADPGSFIGEVRQVKAPLAFLELGYHDNISDALWIEENISAIAQNIVLSLANYFGTPFLQPVEPKPGITNLSWGTLNIRSHPNLDAPVVAQASNGAAVTILNSYDNWYLIRFGDMIGYASKNYILPL